MNIIVCIYLCNFLVAKERLISYSANNVPSRILQYHSQGQLQNFGDRFPDFLLHTNCGCEGMLPQDMFENYVFHD